MKRAVIVLKIAAVFVVAAFATSATGLGRLALWPVVQTCVANYRLTGAPFPCLEVDLSDGTGRDYVVLRPPLLHDLIVVPTRDRRYRGPVPAVAGAPNYFNAAWQARSFLRGADGRAPERRDRTRSQLRRPHEPGPTPYPRGLPRAAGPARACCGSTEGPYWQLGADRRDSSPDDVLGMRKRGTDLSDTEPFRLAAGVAIPQKDPTRAHAASLSVAAAGIRVEGDDQFLILAYYNAGATGNGLLDRNCPTGPSPSG